MIFHTSIRRELTRSFSATLLVLVGVTITMMLIRSMRLANRGMVSPSEVSLVLGYMVLAYLPSLLTLSMFVSMVYCLSRMYRDSEMAVWFASGQGLLQFLKPMTGFAWPIVLITCVLSLAGWPWARGQIYELQQRFQTRGDIDRIAPGQFQESSDGNRVFYINHNPEGGGSGKLFVFARQPQSEVVLSAQNGRIENKETGRFVVLDNGQGVEIMNDQTIHMGQFKEYGIRIGNQIRPVIDAQSEMEQFKAAPHTVSSWRLLGLKENKFRAELGWRLGMSLAGINFVLIALAAANINPRSGRSGSLIFAMLSFAAYYNLINVGQSWVANGKISLAGMLLLLHGGVFVLALFWVYKRHRNWSLRDLFSGRRHLPHSAGSR